MPQTDCRVEKYSCGQSSKSGKNYKRQRCLPWRIIHQNKINYRWMVKGNWFSERCYSTGFGKS